MARWSVGGWSRSVSRWASAAALLLAAGAAGAQQRTTALQDAPAASSGGGDVAPRTGAVILITLDGVRWQEVFEGVDAEEAKEAGLAPDEVVSARELMPNFHAHFMAGGVVLGAPGVGQPFQSTAAAMSLPGYLEILSGRREELCASNRCPATRLPTLLDQMRRRPGGKYNDVAAISSWERIERAATSDPTGFPMSYGRGYGITRDKLGVDGETRTLLKETKRRDPFPGYEDYRPDWITSILALRYLSERQPKLLYIGLGDADEYGHRDDYRSYLGALKQSDLFLGQVFGVLSQLGEYGASTTVIVTTDHGRGAQSFANHGPSYPESRRVWLGAAGGAIPRRGAVASPVERRLADIAPTIRVLLGLKPEPHELSGAVLSELLSPPPPSSN